MPISPVSFALDGMRGAGEEGQTHEFRSVDHRRKHEFRATNGLVECAPMKLRVLWRLGSQSFSNSLRSIRDAIRDGRHPSDCGNGVRMDCTSGESAKVDLEERQTAE